MNGLAGVVVIVPNTGGPIGVGASNVAVKAVRGGVVEDLPKVGRGVEDLAEGDVGVVGREGGHLGDELVVVGVQVGEEGGEVCGGIRVEGGGFVECCLKKKGGGGLSQ